MSFLIRYTAVDEVDGVVHDETVVAELPEVEAIEKEMTVLGRRVTLRIAFDPPLTPSTRASQLERSAS